jgi:hypothetical protein
MGKLERISAIEGETMLEALLRFKVANLPGFFILFNKFLATCSGGEDINKITEKPVDPVAFGPFCRECHIIVADPWR